MKETGGAVQMLLHVQDATNSIGWSQHFNLFCKLHLNNSRFHSIKKTIQGFIETLADDLPPYPIARAPYYPTLLLYIPHLILPIIHDCNRRVIGASLGIHDAIYSNWRSGKAEAVTTNQQRSLQTRLSTVNHASLQ
jgi:hypothetical protein